MSKTLIDKISLLKKGDNVIIYADDTREYNYKGEECVVTSVSKENIYVKDKWDRRYKFGKIGYGEFGTQLFPGSKEELYEYREFLKYKKVVRETFEKRLPYLTKEEVNKIMEIINN